MSPPRPSVLPAIFRPADPTPPHWSRPPRARLPVERPAQAVPSNIHRSPLAYSIPCGPSARRRTVFLRVCARRPNVPWTSTSLLFPHRYDPAMPTSRYPLPSRPSIPPRGFRLRDGSSASPGSSRTSMLTLLLHTPATPPSAPADRLAHSAPRRSPSYPPCVSLFIGCCGTVWSPSAVLACYAC